jgi:MATE family multidrug resistance protein
MCVVRLLHLNRDIFLRTVCLVAVNLFFTSAGARQGDMTLAVNTLLLTFFTLFSYVMDGFAFAGAALSGKFYGAGDDAALRAMTRRLFVWGALMVVAFTAVYVIGGNGFLGCSPTTAGSLPQPPITSSGPVSSPWRAWPPLSTMAS